MYRRDLLKGLTASLSMASALPLLSAAWIEAVSSAMAEVEIRRDIRCAFTAIFSEKSAAQMIGRRYLALYPEEADVDRLWAALAGSSAPSHTYELKARLAQLRQQDFADGEIAVVDGWILARTEARACALLTLV